MSLRTDSKFKKSGVLRRVEYAIKILFAMLLHVVVKPKKKNGNYWLFGLADDIYAKYKDDIKAGTFDISKVDLNDLQLTKIVGNAITNTVKNIGNSIAGFFTKLFQ